MKLKVRLQAENETVSVNLTAPSRTLDPSSTSSSSRNGVSGRQSARGGADRLPAECGPVPRLGQSRSRRLGRESRQRHHRGGRRHGAHLAQGQPEDHIRSKRHTHANSTYTILSALYLFKLPLYPSRLAARHPSCCAAPCETISRSAWTGWRTCTRNTSMAFWQTKRAWARLSRLWPTWPTWLARKVSLFLAMHTAFGYPLLFCFLLSFLVAKTLCVCVFFASRRLGTPPHCSEDVQVAQLGGGVQALVPRPEDPLVLWQQERTEIIKGGRSFPLFPFVVVFFMHLLFLVLPLASKGAIVTLQTFWTRSSAVVGRSQQLPCVRDILQAADERPEPFPEEKVEAYSPG